MSNLLEFQHTIFDEGKAVYSIQNQKLNPTDLEVKELPETVQSFDKETYSLIQLREYILKNSAKLTASGDVIKGEIKEDKVILTILEIQDESSN